MCLTSALYLLCNGLRASWFLNFFREEYRCMVNRSRANAYQNSFFDVGPQMLFYPVIIVLVATWMPLRSSYLYLAGPLLNVVGVAMTYKNTWVIELAAELYASLERLQVAWLCLWVCSCLTTRECCYIQARGWSDKVLSYCGWR